MLSSKRLRATGGEDLSRILNPTPLGEAVNVHVHEAVRDPDADVETLEQLTGQRSDDSEKED